MVAMLVSTTFENGCPEVSLAGHLQCSQREHPRRPPQPSFPAAAFHRSSNGQALYVHWGGPGLVLAGGCGASPS